ncbi:MAG: hydrolase TatD, partial [Plesiomonas shigelloides]
MFDIGVNLTSSQFASDREAVLTRSWQAGLQGLLVTGTSLAESEQA